MTDRKHVTQQIPSAILAAVLGGALVTPLPAGAEHAYVENCEVHRYQTERDNGRIVKSTLFGTAAGAGLGAAGGAIAGGAAGKGAGIGALVGLAGGALYGVNAENQRTDSARRAYTDCLARQGG